MRTIRQIILLLCMSIVFFSCVERTVYSRVTELDRGMIPYHIGDTVRFFNMRKELVTLVVTKDTKYWTWPFDDEVYIEEEQVILESNSGDYKLYVTVNGLHEDRRYLLFSTVFGTKHTGGIVFYNLRRDLLPGEQSSIFDSLLIGNHVYYNVSVSDERPLNGHMQGLYNKEYGVLQTMLDEKTVFTLDTVIFSEKR